MSQEGQDYLKGMAAAANFAWVNRSSMTFLSRQVKIHEASLSHIPDANMVALAV